MRPLVSFYTTVYNNVGEIEYSLRSLIFTCERLKEKYGMESEIVIVDNYSDDGTYEKMLEVLKEIRKHDIRNSVKIIRYSCSRGLGRQIALMKAKGKHVVFITDMDLVYDSVLFSDMIAYYLTNKKLHDKAFYLWLMPKSYAVSVGGINDLNRTEDIEFAARVAKNYEMLPILKPHTYLPSEWSFLKPITPQRRSNRFFITTYISERRYVKSFIGYLRRELRNKLDMIRGMGYTPSKIIQELLYLRNYRGITFFIALAYHMFFFFLVKIMRLPIYSHHPYLNNGSFVDYKMFINYANLLGQLVTSGEMKIDEARHQIVSYLKAQRIRKIVEYISRYEDVSEQVKDSLKLLSL